MNFGERVKQLRKGIGYTQKELGERIGVGRTTISEYESGNIVPKQENLIKLATIFDVTVDYLTGKSDESYYDYNELTAYSDISINGWIYSLLASMRRPDFSPTLFGEKLTKTKYDMVVKELNHLMDILKIIYLMDKNNEV